MDQSGLAFGVHVGPVDVTEAEADWTPPSHIEHGARDLERAADAGDILLSVAAQAQLRDEVTCVAASGGFRLQAIDEMQSGIPARPMKRTGQFVGRQAEMAFLESTLSALNNGAGQAVTLSGPAGIGKTRLVSEFLRAAEDRLDDVLQIKLHCLPSLANAPGAMIRDMCLALSPSGETVPDAAPMDRALIAALREAGATPDPGLCGSSVGTRVRGCALDGCYLARCAD